jgi:hypothetical protein
VAVIETEAKLEADAVDDVKTVSVTVKLYGVADGRREYAGRIRDGPVGSNDTDSPLGPL